MNHPDFRVGGRIFATLGYPDGAWGMVKLYPDQQAAFIKAAPRAFLPVKGAWGKSGCTSVFLEKAAKRKVQEALHAAWRNASVRVAIHKVKPKVTKHSRRGKAVV